MVCEKSSLTTTTQHIELGEKTTTIMTSLYEYNDSFRRCDAREDLLSHTFEFGGQTDLFSHISTVQYT